MAATASNRSAATARDTETQIAREVQKELMHVGEPSAFNLVTMLGGYSYDEGLSKPKEIPSLIRTEKIVSPKIEVIEKDPLGRTLTTGSAVASASTTTIAFSSTSNAKKNDLIKNKSTGEVCFVQTVTNTTDLLVVRNLGSTTFFVGSGDMWYIIGCAHAESTAKTTLKSQIAAPRTRYAQIFKRAFGISRTLKSSSSLLDISPWDEERTQGGYNHKLDIENSVWANPAVDSTTDADSGTVYLSRGVLGEIGDTYSTFYDGSLDESFFFGQFAVDAFKFGGRRKKFFVNSEMLTTVLNFARVKMQTKPTDTKYGIKINEIEMGTGVLELVMCGNFDNTMPTNIGPFGTVLDIDSLRYKVMTDRNMWMEENIQTPGTDAQEGQFVTECAFLLLGLPNHRILRKATLTV